MSSRVPAILAAASFVAVAAGPVLGAGADHLKCFKIRDSAPPARYTVGFETHDNAWPGFSIENGCVVKTPAKMMCIDAIKLSVNPPPPGAPDGQIIRQSYLCYKMKCSRDEPSIPVNDQFGGPRTVKQLGGARMVCAPNSTFSPSGAFLDPEL